MELSGRFGQLVEEDDIQHDPANGQQPIGRAETGGAHGKAGRHAERQDSDGQPRAQPHERGDMRAHMEQPDCAKKHDYGGGRDQSGQQAAAERIVILRPDHAATLPI